MRHKGEEVPADPFDSNCITPGTGFMDRLGHHLRFFIRRKKAEDPLWQAPVVVFSGARVIWDQGVGVEGLQVVVPFPALLHSPQEGG